MFAGKLDSLIEIMVGRQEATAVVFAITEVAQGAGLYGWREGLGQRARETYDGRHPADGIRGL